MRSAHKNCNVSKVVSQYLCHSCGACYAVCKNKAINFEETSGGYLFPKIDSRLCSQCGLCYEVCPGLHSGPSMTAGLQDDPFVGSILSCELGRATDKETYKNSQSGGIATALLDHLLETGQVKAAIVAVMQRGAPPRGKVLIARNTLDLQAAQKSKYVPIPLLTAIPQIKAIDGCVALVGLPCHIHGLINLFDTDPVLRTKVIIKIGLVCDRIMTNSAIDFMGCKAAPSEISNLVFRDKQKPSYPGNPVVTIGDEKEIVLKASFRMAIKDFFTPLRCRLCFDKLNVFSDLVLGDPHNIKNADRHSGETLLITRTEVGKNFVSDTFINKKILLRPVDTQEVLSGQKIYQKRQDWGGYMKAQSLFGRNSPEYPGRLLKYVGFPDEKSKKYIETLQLCLRLDEYGSRPELFKEARKWLIKRRKTAVLRFPFTQTIKFVRAVMNGFRYFWGHLMLMVGSPEN